MTRLCICQICQCGRHRCAAHDVRKEPFAKGPPGAPPDSETKDRFGPFAAQPRVRPVVPSGDGAWHGDEPMAKSSLTTDDYGPYGMVKKREAIRPKVVRRDPGLKMAGSTTYGKDFQYQGDGLVPVKGKMVKSDSAGTMPGSQPGDMVGVSTYGRSYTPKPVVGREPARPQPNNLGLSGKPFQGTTETARCYQRPEISKRQPARPRQGEIKLEGPFEGESITRSDFPVYPHQLPVKSCRKSVSWTPGTAKFRGESTYKSQYRYPELVSQPIRRIPDTSLKPSTEPFDSTSAYRTDFPAYAVLQRMEPPWIPNRIYKTPSVPMVGSTSYKRDYLCPPEDVLCAPRKSLPVKGNLTRAEGPMEGRTTQMRDFLPNANPIMRKSFKPDADYKKPEGKIADQSLTMKDYTWKAGEKLKQTRQKDNLVSDTSPMQDLTMTMKDYQWMAIDCPAAYIQNIGKDALPQFKFDKVVAGHEYFKKLKKLKNIC